jgi:hypothetical protein
MGTGRQLWNREWESLKRKKMRHYKIQIKDGTTEP